MSCHEKQKNKEGGQEIAATWPPILAVTSVAPCYGDQRSAWTAEDGKWYPRHPVRIKRGLRGPVRFPSSDLSSAVKQISLPAVVSKFVPLFNYSKAPGHSYKVLRWQILLWWCWLKGKTTNLLLSTEQKFIKQRNSIDSWLKMCACICVWTTLTWLWERGLIKIQGSMMYSASRIHSFLTIFHLKIKKPCLLQSWRAGERGT